MAFCGRASGGRKIRFSFAAGAPFAVVFLCVLLQRHSVKGVTAGALKG
jgi:hypothetical protein